MGKVFAFLLKVPDMKDSWKIIRKMGGGSTISKGVIVTKDNLKMEIIMEEGFTNGLTVIGKKESMNLF